MLWRFDAEYKLRGAHAKAARNRRVHPEARLARSEALYERSGTGFFR